MPAPALRIWCNMGFPAEAQALLTQGTTRHQFVMADNLTTSNLVAAKADPKLEEADVVFGQPHPDHLLNLPRVKWVHLTSAGYERYDRPDLRSAFQPRSAALTNSSGVYEEPCAEHALAMILALARRLPQSVENQRVSQGWPAAMLRAESRLLTGQTALLLGFGSIARRLAELLAPFRMRLLAVRRTPRGDEPIPTHPQSDIDRLLPQADHVINILPGGAATAIFMTPARFALMKPSAIFYNIGRGGTIDQDALLDSLRTGRLAAAYLDVTSPEPLPPDHPLWSTPNCFITPHTAGGHHDEHVRLVQHFLNNLDRFENGTPLSDRVI